jgi:hypothetical protein
VATSDECQNGQKHGSIYGSPALSILLANSGGRSICQNLGKMGLAGKRKTAVPNAPDEFASSITFDKGASFSVSHRARIPGKTRTDVPVGGLGSSKVRG